MKYETKLKIQDFYIKHKNYFSMGFSLVYDFKTYVSTFLLVILTINSFELEIALGIIVMIALISVVGFWFVGRYMDSIGFFHRLNEFNNKRDLFVEEMRNFKEELLEEIRNEKRK